MPRTTTPPRAEKSPTEDAGRPRLAECTARDWAGASPVNAGRAESRRRCRTHMAEDTRFRDLRLLSQDRQIRGQGLEFDPLEIYLLGTKSNPPKGGA